jgi:hypothetical protein
VRSIPELFISQSPFLNAGAIGVEKPFVIVNSSMLKDLDDLEIMSVLGHEVGHCVSGHVLYKTMLWLLLTIPFTLFQIPLAEIAIRLIIMALLEWYRKSELSADRAGLLAAQSSEASFRLQMKMAGGSDLSQMDINEFFTQALEYDKGGTLLDSVFKLLNLSQETHPFPVLRLTELKTWVDAGSYDKILGGDYIKRSDAAEDDVESEFKKAQDQYKEDINKSKDPLAEAISNVMKNVEPVTQKLQEVFGSLFNLAGPKEEPKKDEGKKDDGDKEKK